MNGYEVAQLEQIDELSDGRCPYRPVRHHFGIKAFGMTAWTAANAGDRIVNEHEEDDGNEELYFVARGRAAFELDGERVDAPAGTFVFVRPGVTRTAFAEEAGTTVLAVGGDVGKAYEPVGWELWAPIRPLYEAGDNEAAAERLRETIASGGDYPLLWFNLACLESLTGRKTEALEHLRRAIEESEQFRAIAQEDTDLDAIRDQPGFKELVGS